MGPTKFEYLSPTLEELLCRLSVYRLPIDLLMTNTMAGTIEDLGLLVEQNFLLSQGVNYVLHPLVTEWVMKWVTEELLQDAHTRASRYYQECAETIASCQEEFYHTCELELYGVANAILDRYFELFSHAKEYQLLLPLYEQLTKEWEPMNEEEEKNFELASLLYEQLRKEWDATCEDKKNLALTLTVSGDSHHEMGDSQSAITDYLQANDIFDRLHFTKWQVLLCQRIGHVYDSIGEYQKAIDFYSQQNEMAQAIGDNQGIANSLGNLGVANHSLGNYQKAIDFYSQQNELAQAIDDNQGIANSLGNLGAANHSLGNYQKAIDCHSQSMKIDQEIGDKKSIANNLCGLGNAYNALGNYKKAIDSYLQSLEIAQAIGDTRKIADLLFNLGHTLRKTDDHFKALQNYAKSKEVYENLKLDPMVRKCNTAIYTCIEAIASSCCTPQILEDE